MLRDLARPFNGTAMLSMVFFGPPVLRGHHQGRALKLTWVGNAAHLVIPAPPGLDVRIEGGRFTCLLGPSGVGKSSLLRLIAGLEPRAAGTVVQLGGNGDPRRDIAYMAQTDLLLPWLTAIENVALGARLRGERADKTGPRL